MPNIYRAVVENNQDPTYQNRVQVRIIGMNTGNTSSGFQTVLTEHLPWAEVMGSTEFGLISGVGISSVLRQGTWVWVMLEDDNPSKPIVLGVVHGIANQSDEDGFKDPDGVYPKSDRTGSADINPSMNGDKYTTMQMIETPCGHTIELDDTDGDNRIKVTHSSGTYMLIDNDGNIWVYGVKNAQYDITENVTWNIGGNLEVNVQGNSTYYTAGNRSETTDGNSTFLTKGNRDETVNGNSTYTTDGTRSETIGSSSTIDIGGSLTETIGGGGTFDTSNVAFTNTITVATTGTAGTDFIAGAISLVGHVHGGVYPGSSMTSTPV